MIWAWVVITGTSAVILAISAIVYVIIDMRTTKWRTGTVDEFLNDVMEE